MQPSRVFKMLFSRGPSPSTMTWPPPFFHALATSSSTRSARPSSRHPEPQCRPMNVARAARAGDVSVRLCFFVNVLKARGRKVVGGSMMGKTVGLSAGGAGTGAVRSGRAGLTGGVAKAGEDDGTGSEIGSTARRLMEAIMVEVVVETCGGATRRWESCAGETRRENASQRGALFSLGRRNISAPATNCKLYYSLLLRRSPQLAPTTSSEPSPTTFTSSHQSPAPITTTPEI